MDFRVKFFLKGIVLLLLSTLVFFGCSELADTIENSEEDIDGSISLDKHFLNLNVEEVFQLQERLIEITTTPNISWQSSDASIVTVNAEGELTALSVGSAIITVYFSDQLTTRDTCDVTVVTSNAADFVVTLNNTNPDPSEALTLTVTPKNNNVTVNYTLESIRQLGYGYISLDSSIVNSGVLDSSGSLSSEKEFQLTFSEEANEFDLVMSILDSDDSDLLLRTTINVIVSGVAESVAPSSPVFLTSPSHDSKVYLSWENPEDDDFLDVQLRVSTTGFPSSVSEGELLYSGTGTSVTHNNLSNGVWYYYSLFARDYFNNWSEAVTIQVSPVNSIAPAAPSHFAVTTGDEKVEISWENPDDDDFDSVLLRVSTSGYPASSTSGSEVYSGSDTSVVHNDLDNGTTYHYSIFSVDVSGNVSVGVTGQSTPEDVHPPAAPDNFSVVTGSEELVLYWDNPEDADFTEVQIRVSTTDYPSSEEDGTELYSGSGTVVTHNNLEHDTTYYYSIFASDEADNWSTANRQISATVLDSIAPASPTEFEAPTADSKSTLSWINPADDDFDSVLIRVSTAEYPETVLSGSSVYSGTDESVTHEDLVNNTLYYYSLFAVDDAGNVSSVVTLNARPLNIEGPASPSDFSITKGDFELALSWENPDDADFDEVVILASTVNYLSDYDEDSVIYSGSGTSYTHEELDMYETYYYSVFAVDVSGNVSDSAAQASSDSDTTDAEKVSIGYQNIAILLEDGTLMTTGANSNSQLGYEIDDNKSYQFKKSLSAVQDVDLGTNFAIALDNNGVLYGVGKHDQKFGGSTKTLSEWTLAYGATPITLIEIGAHNMLFLVTEDGDVLVAGSAVYATLAMSYAQVGYLVKLDSWTELDIDNIVDLSVGVNAFLGLKDNGELWVAGVNINGDIGVPTADVSSLSQFTYVTDNVKSVHAAGYVSIIIKENGDAYGAGGDDSVSPGAFPIALEAPLDNGFEFLMSDVAFAAVSNEYSCLIKEDGSLWVSGEDYTEYTYIASDVVDVSVSQDSFVYVTESGNVYGKGSGHQYGFGRESWESITGDPELIYGEEAE